MLLGDLGERVGWVGLRWVLLRVVYWGRVSCILVWLKRKGFVKGELRSRWFWGQGIEERVGGDDVDYAAMGWRGARREKAGKRTDGFCEGVLLDAEAYDWSTPRRRDLTCQKAGIMEKMRFVPLKHD